MVNSLKVKIAISYLLLLSAGMILIDVVLVSLWQRQAVEQFFLFGQEFLSIVSNNPSDAAAILSQIGQYENQSAFFFLDDNFQVFPSNCIIPSSIKKTISIAALTSQSVTQYMGSTWSVFGLTYDKLLIVYPINVDNSTPAAAGIIFDLQSVYTKLKDSQGLVAVYILVNTVILSVLGLFRMVSYLVKPLEDLVRGAEAYQFDNDVDFVVENKGHEIRKLSCSLRSMVRRIEGDRNKLSETVQSLSEVNKELEETRNEVILAEKMAAVGVLSAGMAHEIGNPLGIIAGYFELLSDENLTEKERKLFIKNAISEVERIDSIINSLLDFARNGDVAEDFVEVKILCDWVESMVRVHKKMKNIHYSKEIRLKKPIYVRGKKSLMQILLNCILNAVDAVESRKKDEKKKISLYCEEGSEDGHNVVIIKIQDNGVGIEEEHLSFVFDPFFTTKGPGKGTGLGLSVSYSLMEALDGKIRIASEFGAGTIISLILPALSDQELVCCDTDVPTFIKTDSVTC